MSLTMTQNKMNMHKTESAVRTMFTLAGSRRKLTGIRNAYGENYARLQKIKRKYDPYNLFRMNQNITPAQN